MLRTFVVKGDTNLRSLGNTLLNARFRGAQADAALERLKALNPHADPERIPAGTVLFVPDQPGFKASAATSTQAGPLDDFRALLSSALSDAARNMKTGNAQRAAERADVSAVVKSAVFRRIVGDDRGIALQVSDAQKAMAAEESDDRQAEEALSAMSKAALEALTRLGRLSD